VGTRRPRLVLEGPVGGDHLLEALATDIEDRVESPGEGALRAIPRRQRPGHLVQSRVVNRVDAAVGERGEPGVPAPVGDQVAGQLTEDRLDRLRPRARRSACGRLPG